MKYLDLKKKGNLFVLTMTDGDNDNRFSLDVVSEYNSVIDEIESSKENAALVITSNHPKTWSTGINIDYMLGLSTEDRFEFTQELKKMILRLTLLNLPTIGCITGNCYAGAAIMASGLDFRLMREDRGRFCFPEVNIKIPFGATFSEIISLLPNRHALNELVLTGVAWGGVECLLKNIVDTLYSEAELPIKAMELAQMMAEKDRQTYTTIKHQLRKSLVDMLASGEIS